MSPTIMSTSKPSSTMASAPPSTPTSTGRIVADVGAQRAQVALVVHPAHHHQGGAVAEVGGELRQLELAGQQLALGHHVLDRVLGERLQRLADRLPALLGERQDGRRILHLARWPSPRRRAGSRRRAPAPRRRRRGARTARIRARRPGGCRPARAAAARCSGSARWSIGAVDDRLHPAGDQVLGRHPVDVEVVDDRHVAAAQALGQAAWCACPAGRFRAPRAGLEYPARPRAQCTSWWELASGSASVSTAPVRRRGAARVRAGGRPRRRRWRRASAPALPSTSPAVQPGHRGLRRCRAPVSLTMRKWRSASEATWGRWVMHRTWWRAGQVAQPLAHGPGGVPADAGVDLVEHQQRAVHGFRLGPGGRAAPGLGGHPHQRQHHPRQLAAGGDLAQRPGRARRDWARSGTRPPRRRWPPAASGAPGPTSNPAPSIASSARRSRTAAARRGASRRRALGCSRAPARPARPRPVASSAVSSSRAVSAPSSSAARARQRSAWASTASIVPPCLRVSRSSSARRSSTSCRRAGAASTSLPVAAQLGAQVVGLVQQGAQALAQLVQSRVEVRHGVDVLGRLGQSPPTAPPAPESGASASAPASAAAARRSAPRRRSRSARSRSSSPGSGAASSISPSSNRSRSSSRSREPAGLAQLGQALVQPRGVGRARRRSVGAARPAPGRSRRRGCRAGRWPSVSRRCSCWP